VQFARLTLLACAFRCVVTRVCAPFTTDNPDDDDNGPCAAQCPTPLFSYTYVVFAAAAAATIFLLHHKYRPRMLLRPYYNTTTHSERLALSITVAVMASFSVFYCLFSALAILTHPVYRHFPKYVCAPSFALVVVVPAPRCIVGQIPRLVSCCRTFLFQGRGAGAGGTHFCCLCHAQRQQQRRKRRSGGTERRGRGIEEICCLPCFGSSFLILLVRRYFLACFSALLVFVASRHGLICSSSSLWLQECYWLVVLLLVLDHLGRFHSIVLPRW